MRISDWSSDVCSSDLIPARQCLGLAYMAMDRAAPAAVVFEQAARAAEAVQDQRVTDLWGQAGNAWLVAGEAEKARAAFNTALAHGGGSDEWQGEQIGRASWRERGGPYG